MQKNKSLQIKAFSFSIIHNQIQIDELHAEDIFMYFGIPQTHLQYVNINAA
jgi:hypothetical protein